MHTCRLPFFLFCFLFCILGCVVEDTASQDGDGNNAATTGDGEETAPMTDAGPQADIVLTEVDDEPAETGGECSRDADCGNFILVCRQGLCLDRCFNDVCFRGGMCMDGACYPPECTDENDAQCAEGEICRNDECIQRVGCESNTDCGENERCRAQVCEPLPRCVGDRNCARDEICELGYCQQRPTCADDASICGENEACIGDRCVPSGCRGLDDCAEGERCQGGQCVARAIPEVAEVRILTPGRGLSSGMTIQLQAVGLNNRGQIVTSDGFEWSASNDLLDNLGDGSFVALTSTGEVSVTAVFPNVDPPIESVPVLFRILPEAPPGIASVRVVGPTGAPVSGARVVSGTVEVISNEDGVAVFDESDIGNLVTVFADGYDYMSLIRADCEEILVPLSPRTDLTVASGIEGVVNFDNIADEGEVETSLTGTALTGGILGLSLERLIGAIFYGRFSFFGRDFDLPLPGGLTLSGDLPIIGPLDLKNRFYLSTDPGLRLVWSFAGRLDFQTITSFVNGGGNFDLGQVLTTVLPFFETFSHGLKTIEDVQSAATVPDEDDLDGDGDSRELIPDYTRNPELTMNPIIDQNLRVQVSLPSNLEDVAEVALLFMGAELPEVGFVPLGVTASDAPGDIPARLALPYGPLAGANVTAIAAATNFEGGADLLPTDLSVLVRRYARSVPGDITFERDFLEYDRDFEYLSQVGALSASPTSSGTLSRWSLQGSEVRWIVQANGIHNVDVTLPQIPEGFPRLGPAPIVLQETIDLGDAPFDALACPTPEGTLQDVDRLTIRFSRSSPR